MARGRGFAASLQFVVINFSFVLMAETSGNTLFFMSPRYQPPGRVLPSAERRDSARAWRTWHMPGTRSRPAGELVAERPPQDLELRGRQHARLAPPRSRHVERKHYQYHLQRVANLLEEGLAGIALPRLSRGTLGCRENS